MIILNGWYGFLGNNIIQLSNIIHIAIIHKHNIIFNVKHKLFDLSIIERYFSKYNNSKKLSDRYNFFYKNKLPYSNNIFEQNIDERNKLLQNAFLIKNVTKLPENDLVIHIRSGDIFSSNPHPEYVPPPLSYYINEIDIFNKINKCNNRKIHIISQDTVNPVVNELLKLYKNSVYQKNTLETDIRVILGATNIIFSIGTFVPSLIRLSDNIEYIYGSKSSRNVDEMKEYYKIMHPWKNTKVQRDYILNYKYNQ